MKNLIYTKLLALGFLILTNISLFSQGVVISNNSGDTPDESAILDIKSTTQGLLIPRVTTVQRNAIDNGTGNPTNGLLVYDTDEGSFFIYGKTYTGSLGWNNLSTQAGIWQTNASDVFLSNSYTNVGIGTSTPKHKFVIKAESDTDTLFEIQDMNGRPLMIITPHLTKFNIMPDAKAASGGFAVGRYGLAKAATDSNLFLVTRDSTRVYTAQSGGFAVGRYGLAKGKPEYSFITTQDSTRVYAETGMKAQSGGFAVGRYGIAKGKQDYTFFTAKDSTRIYTDQTAKGTSGGFAVGRYGLAKGSSENYLYMLPDNYFIGHQAGDSLQNSTYTGKYNTFFGFHSGLKDTSGSNNVFVGRLTGFNNTSGYSNIFLGNEAGYNNNEGADNTFVGTQSGFNNTIGFFNTFIGHNTGHENIDGIQNTFVGYNAGHGNSGGNSNTFIGQESGYSNSNGHENTYIGQNTGALLANGTRNTFMGYYAGQQADGGENNIFLGVKTGQYHHEGNSNVFLGNEAGISTASSTGISHRNVILGAYAGGQLDGAIDNVFIGHKAGEGGSSLGVPVPVTGDYNVIIGEQAGCWLQTGNSNVFIGKGAGSSNRIENNNVFVGNNAGHSNTGGENNVFVGTGAGQNNDGDDNVFLGNLSGANNQGDYNINIGSGSGGENEGEKNIFIGYYAGFANEGADNIFIGQKSGVSNTTGQKNIFIGDSAGFENLTGKNNVYVGFKSGYNSDNAEHNVFIGDSTGFSNQNGIYNTFVGYNSGKLTTGSATTTSGNFNSFFGCKTGLNNTTGYYNTFVGQTAGAMNSIGDRNSFLGNNAGFQNTEGYRNVFLGASSGNNNTTGNANIAIGYAAGYNNSTGSENIFIGYGAGYNETGSEKLYIDNSTTATPLIHGDFLANTLQINGDLTFNEGANSVTLPAGRGSAGQALITGGDGTSSWATTSGSSAANGVNIETGVTELGGLLNEVTTISLEAYDMRFDMTGLGDFEVRDAGATCFYVGDNGNVGIGTDVPAHQLHLLSNVSTTAGTDGNLIDIENASTSAHVMSGIRFKNGSTANTFKGAIFYYDEETYGRGDIVFANSNVGDDATTVSYADARMIIKSNGNIGVGTTIPNATLDVNGSVSMNIVTVSASNYTITDTDGYYTILMSSTLARTITLPTASANTGRIIRIKRIGTNTVTIDGEGSETIDGSLTKIISVQYQGYVLQSDGSNWWVISVIDNSF